MALFAPPPPKGYRLENASALPSQSPASSSGCSDIASLTERAGSKPCLCSSEGSLLTCSHPRTLTLHPQDVVGTPGEMGRRWFSKMGADGRVSEIKTVCEQKHPGLGILEDHGHAGGGEAGHANTAKAFGPHIAAYHREAEPLVTKRLEPSEPAAR